MCDFHVLLCDDISLSHLPPSFYPRVSKTGPSIVYKPYSLTWESAPLLELTFSPFGLIPQPSH